jgi:hypothetical protein
MSEINPAKAKDKNYAIYKDLFQFYKDHLPEYIHVGPGKIRSKSHLLPKTIDLIFYKKWAGKLIEMSSGWHLIDYSMGIMSIERKLSTQALVNHINLSQAIKTLYAKTKNYGKDDYIPLCSILWAYDNNVPLLSHQKAIYDAQKEKNIPYNCEMDMVVILDKGIILKDWEKGNFKVIETGKDTMMWGYILTIEYLGLDRLIPFMARNYVKRTENYVEY